MWELETERVVRKIYRQTTKNVASNYNISLVAQQGITKGKLVYIIIWFWFGHVPTHQVKHITMDLSNNN